MNHIGELNERSLHAQLKTWYAKPGDALEVSVEGYVIDIVRGELLIEIQTGNFSSLKRKLNKLVANHPVRLVYPIAAEKWLHKLPQQDGDDPIERKSPKHGRIEDVFKELVYIPGLVGHPNFELEALLIHEREVRERREKKRWRRKGWATVERQLIEVIDSRVFLLPEDYSALLGSSLPVEFTTLEIAKALKTTRRLAQQIAYALRAMDEIRLVGKQGRANLYSRN